MIRIAITPAAYAVIESSSPKVRVNCLPSATPQATTSCILSREC